MMKKNGVIIEVLLIGNKESLGDELTKWKYISRNNVE